MSELTTIKPQASSALESLEVECAALLSEPNSITKVLQSAEMITKLQAALSQPGIMSAIMALQGNPVGFMTDKDTSGGYPMETVRDVTITAMMNGAHMINNECNIIKGKAYFTQSLFLRKLDELKGLNGQYKILPALPHVNADKSGCTIDVALAWTFKGVDGTESIPLAIKTYPSDSPDLIKGKAIRKAAKWLYQYLAKIRLPDGDVGDPIDIEASDPAAAKQTMEAAAKPSELEHPPDGFALEGTP